MVIRGRIHNGVVVLEQTTASLLEGTEVTVVVETAPMAAIRIAKNQKRVEFPLVRSSAPGSIHLTNQMIDDILDAEDASS
jgi:hypothetical protein